MSHDSLIHHPDLVWDAQPWSLHRSIKNVRVLSKKGALSRPCCPVFSSTYWGTLTSPVQHLMRRCHPHKFLHIHCVNEQILIRISRVTPMLVLLLALLTHVSGPGTWLGHVEAPCCWEAPHARNAALWLEEARLGWMSTVHRAGGTRDYTSMPPSRILYRPFSVLLPFSRFYTHSVGHRSHVCLATAPLYSRYAFMPFVGPNRFDKTVAVWSWGSQVQISSMWFISACDTCEKQQMFDSSRGSLHQSIV